MHRSNLQPTPSITVGYVQTNKKRSPDFPIKVNSNDPLVIANQLDIPGRQDTLIKAIKHFRASGIKFMLKEDKNILKELINYQIELSESEILKE